MSLNIKQDHKFTPEEIQYLKDRCQHQMIAENESREFPTKRSKKPSKDDVLRLDKDIYDHVVDLDLKQLQEELRKIHIVPQGNESELRTLLAAHLQDERDSKKT